MTAGEVVLGGNAGSRGGDRLARWANQQHHQHKPLRFVALKLALGLLWVVVHGFIDEPMTDGDRHSVQHPGPFFQTSMMSAIARLRQLLIDPEPARWVDRLWWIASVLFGLGYGLAILPEAFADPYVVADDGRQHLFWMLRLSHPDAFPGDWIADYFESVAPWGFRAIYWFPEVMDWGAVTAAKGWPLILSGAIGGLAWAVTRAILPVPFAGFVAALLFLQNLWLKDDLASGTARAFLNPLFLMVLWAWVKRSPWGLCLAIGLLGGFYPHYVLVTAAMLTLRLAIGVWRREAHWRIWAIGLGVCVAVLLPFAANASTFGPTITVDQARQLPEFLPNGRSRFFYEDFGRFWLSAGRSGIQPPLEPPLLVLGLGLPLIWRWRDRFPLWSQVRSGIEVLPLLTLASFGCFGLAHLLLFRLHLPSRYTQHGLRAVLAIATGIALVLLLDRLWTWAQGQRRLLAWGLTLGAIGLLVAYPLAVRGFPKANYVIGQAPDLYEILADYPNNTRIATLSGEASNIPTFAGKSVLVGAEFAIPYHWGYYREFRSRVETLLRAQYSPDLSLLRAAIAQYQPTHWLLDPGAFDRDYLENNDWLRQYQPAYGEARRWLARGQRSALAQRVDRCLAAQSQEGLLLLDANCLAQTLPPTAPELPPIGQ